jgi:hypothetical protein
MVTPGIDLGCNEVEVLTGWGVSTTAAVDVGESSLAGWSGGGERRWLGHGAAVSWGRGLGSSCWVGDGLRWATHGEVELGDGGGGGAHGRWSLSTHQHSGGTTQSTTESRGTGAGCAHRERGKIFFTFVDGLQQRIRAV